ncbi:YveK family protein [Listeria booriae]|uniref:Polysaccharide chain length determinant N-terminal domain-containing protein n=1 Tax=Listeria booriae TaxID=1552123 RepID=A0A7X0XR59_9LIST|nr:Wzz/FepE/Etk N-terminal domain-containing protein [Listeria booriae]MBC1573923.1 hypothetical protein [Listeria booriae]MBC1779205.1 hypothetical protein [Listeria booriae]MBC1888751.1 hypothetical protein [Listeria booriae]MBC2103694.1 hypothetical protein [Listeria booriae]MBC2116285.1 hypothetical protein [Listeria booriae]
MEKMIDLRVVAKRIKQYLWILVVAAVVGIGGSALWATQIATPKYQATADIFVKPQKLETEDFRLDANTNNRLISTYSGILKSHKIIDQVKMKLDIRESFQTIVANLNIKNENESQIISISYTTTTPEEAVKVVNTTIRVMEVEVGALLEGDTIKVLSKATVEEAAIPVSPNIKMSLLMGLFIGLVGGMIIMAAILFSNNTIRENEDIEEITNIPILGEIEKW